MRDVSTLPKKFMYIKDILGVMGFAKKWSEVPPFFFNTSLQKIVEFKNGSKFLIRHYLDLLIVNEIYQKNEYPMAEYKNLKTIVDIGANIGVFSIFAAQNFPQASIFSYEPAPGTFSALNENIKLNQIKNIKTFQQAVAGTPGTLEIFESEASGLSSLYVERKGGRRVQVPTVTLQQIFEANNIDTVDFMKMDCEGAEYEIFFKTNPELLNKIKTLVMEYHDGITPHHHSELQKFFNDKGFKVEKRPHDIENDIGVFFITKASTH